MSTRSKASGTLKKATFDYPEGEVIYTQHEEIGAWRVCVKLTGALPSVFISRGRQVCNPTVARQLLDETITEKTQLT
jgi:hypothetical protein